MYTKADIKDIYFLTPMQEGMLFHHLMHPASSVYLEQFHFSLQGEFNPRIFEKTIALLVEKYEALRTVFIHKNVKKAVQVVLKQRVQSIRTEQVIGLDETAQSEFIEQYKASDRSQPFDLTLDAPVRLTVIERSDRRVDVIWTFHHIILDGWSVGLLLRDFRRMYRQLKRNRPIRTRQVLPFSNYIQWLEKQDKDSAMDYWNHYLSGYEQRAGVPAWKPDNAEGEAYSLSEVSFTVNRALTERLEALARKSGVTLSTMLHMIWGIVLQKYNNVDDVVFGSVVSGRPPEVSGIEQMVGMFINSIPVRIRRNDQTTFAELLETVRDHVALSSGNEFVALPEIQNASLLKRELLDHVLVFENYPLEEGIQLKNERDLGFVLSQVQVFEQTNYHFNVVIVPSGEISIRLGYNTKVYDQVFIEGIQRHIELIAESLLDRTDMRISELMLLPGTDAATSGSAKGTEYSALEQPGTLTQWLKQQASQNPDNVALVYGESKLTYAELDGKSNTLARELREWAIGPGDIIGIMAEPSLEMIVAIWGVLKAGAGYVPIDPEFSAERQAYMLKDSEARLLITQEGNLRAEELPVETLYLASNEMENGAEIQWPDNDPTDTAYVIYTSGTTGVPKGVAIAHHNLVNYLSWFQRTAELRSSDKTALTSSFAFDLGYTALFSAMVSGCELHLLDKELYASPQRLLEYGRVHNLTFLKMTPTLYSTLQNETEAAELFFPSLRVLVLGGEPIHVRDVERTFQLSSNIQVMNHYGPTEATIGSIAQWMERDGLEQFSQMPTIGKPIDNTRIYIVDKNNHLMPTGLAGEICIAGNGVGKGYINREDLNSSKFLILSLSGREERLYRTGDRGRVLPDGSIAYLGRIDDQIKIRGYRVEPAEVAYQIQQHKDITDAVVIGRQDSSGQNLLCAYYVTDSGLKPAELRAFLTQLLPDFMIPTYFMELDTLPVTPNGKVNKKELPEPEAGAFLYNIYEAPRNKLESKLTYIWQEVLNIERVGIQDDFFLLGGHSLKAMVLVSRIQKELSIEVPLKQLFVTSTVAGLADWMGGAIQRVQVPIQSAESRVMYSASPVQQRIYALSQLDDHSTTYNMPNIWIVDGELDRLRLQQAMKDIIGRHEILRTSYLMTEEGLMQQVHQEFSFEVPDITGDRDSVASIIDEFIAPFALDRVPMLRAQTVRIEDGRQLLLMDIHHIASDGISTAILFQELMDLYAGCSIEEATIQYKDYTEWRLSSEGVEERGKQEQFWKEQLQDDLPVLNLPSDFPRPAVQSFKGDFIDFTLNGAAVDDIRRLSRETGATLFMVLLAAYNILLSKYTGQEDIIVGSVSMGRPHADLERTMGMFVNTVAHRNYPEGDKTVFDFLKEIKERSLDVFENQHYPFDELLDVLRVRREKSRNPIFDTMFILENMDVPQIELGHAKLSYYPFDYKIAKFDMTVFAEERMDEIVFRWEYGTDLFQRETIRRFSEHYLNIIQEMTRKTDAPIKELQLISEEERAVIVQEFNDTWTDYPRDLTVPQLFEEQAAKFPTHVALVSGEEQMTYEELDQQSGRLAYLLRTQGVGPGHRVGLMVERSFEMIIGILGILKAGGAYVPIDPEYSQERIGTIIEDARIQVLLTQSLLVTKIHETTREVLREVIWLDGLHALQVNESFIPFPCQIDSSSPAYVMYTSGSTGKPKGTISSHSGIIRIVRNTNYIKITEDDALLQLSNYAFDGSTFDIFGALLNGAKLVLIDKESISDIAEWTKMIENERISLLFITTALFNTVVDVNVEALSQVRKVLFGGERVSVNHVRRALDTFGDDKLIHVYGPTESTVFATYQEVKALSNSGTLPIGRPVSNTQVFIVDRYHQLQPIGALGEIMISGDGLSLGYLNQAEMTAEKFVEHAYLEGCTMYKTGDLGRWLPDGSIEFHGRIDQQVKIRGFRVEPGEIEAVLLQLAGVQEGVVLAKDNGIGNKQLCAYLVTDELLKPTDIRHYLSQRLPEYMIPAHFIFMDSLPLTSNGKVNTRALPEPMHGLLEAGDQLFEGPANTQEELLLQLWKEVLGVQGIGVHDDFFGLGGHSLKAMVLLAKIQQQFQLHLPLSKLFSGPTVRQLSENMNLAQPNLERVVPVAEFQVLYPASSAQQRIYASSMREPDNIGYNIPFAVYLDGELDLARLGESLQELTNRHEALRTVFEEVEGTVAQRILPEQKIPLEHYQGTEEQSEEMMGGFIRPFELTKGPLVRCGIGTLSTGRHLLMLDMHHSISDGSSIAILFKEWMQLYRRELLPPVWRQYKDYAVWQQQFIRSESMKAQENYWIEQLQGDIPALNLPVDFPRPAVRSFEGASLTATLNEELFGRIGALSRETGTTSYMVLMAAFQIMLAKITGEQDLLVGTVAAGRTEGDIHDTVGMFAQTLVIRGNPAFDKTGKQFLQEIKMTTLNAFENQDYPFDHLVHALDVKPDASRNPLFDAMFIYENTESGRLQFGDTVCTPIQNSAGSAKTDLTLVAVEEIAVGISLKWDYSLQLFKLETVKRLSRYFTEVLSQLCSCPDTSISMLEMVNGAEKEALLFGYNNTAVEYEENNTLLLLFEEQAVSNPEQIALVHGDSQITYGALNERAEQMARGFVSLGIQPSATVAVMLDRSIEMVIGILAIWKAGGAYVPLDPDYPQERISFMLEDCGAKWLLINEQGSKKIHFSGTVINFEKPVEHQDEGTLPLKKSPDDLAYVIYTSGTTGRPKGVAVTQRSIANTLQWRREAYALGISDTVLQLFSFSFDGFLTSLFTPLISGSRVVLLSDREAKDPFVIADSISDYHVTHFIAVPSLYLALLECCEAERLHSLNQVTLAGEQITKHVIEESKRLLPHTELMNEYGPTENSVATTFFRNLQPDRPVYIGKPIANTEIYVLGKDHLLMPAGMEGELCISGTGLAAGYLNRPELNAEKFISNPYFPEKRMYKTGDLVKWLPDGNLCYIGRIDRQIKIRGYRIETDEIENELLRHEAVTQALVIGRKDDEGKLYLCAYIIGEGKVEDRELRKHLSCRLPDYMLPAAFIHLEQFPLTSNGKTDIAALPAPKFTSKRENEDSTFQNECERSLAEVWNKVLGKTGVTASDNFFELGGDSIRAISLVSEIHKQMGIKVAIAELFHYPTIRELASLLEQEQRETLARVVVSLEASGLYPASSAQKRMFVLNQMQESSTVYNMPVALMLDGVLDRTRLEQALEQLIARHEPLRTSFHLNQGKIVQQVHSEVPFRMGYRKIPEVSLEKALKSYSRSFDVTRAPLFRAVLLNIHEQRNVLFLDMHHIVSDGTSISVLLRDLTALYNGTGLSKLEVQYKDFSVWQENFLQSEMYSEQKSYWMKMFSGVLPSKDLPTDHPRSVTRTYEGRDVCFEAEPELREALKKLSITEGTTLNNVLAACYHIWLSKYVDSEDVIVGCGVSGRSHGDLSSMVGMLVNTAAIRSRPQGKKTFRTFLRELKEETLSAFNHLDFPFEHMISDLKLARDASRNPLFDTLFELQSLADTEADPVMNGLAVQRLDIRSGLTKFDLALFAGERSDRLYFSFNYRTSLFREETVVNMANQYMRVLRTMAEAPDCYIQEVDIHSPAEEIYS
ncbi:amino acid adenylation domain-containing protein [Paenibacillus sp. Marseille-Q9583]